MPTPKKGESKEEFIDRCIPIVLKDGTAEDQDQAVAICNSLWGQESNAMDMTVESRVTPAEVRVDQRGRIEGYAAVFNELSVDLGGFRERIRPGAFTKTISEADIRATFNHDANYVLGRNTSGTLELSEDSRGLNYRVDPPKAQWADDLRESIRRGDISQSSFKFGVIRDVWGKSSDGEHQRDLIEVKLYDVSPVTFPAYPQTSVAARSLASMFISQVRKNADPEAVEFMLEQLAQLERAAAPAEGHPAARTSEGSESAPAEGHPDSEAESNDAAPAEGHPVDDDFRFALDEIKLELSKRQVA